MQHPVLNFLSSALVPELRPHVAASTSGNVKLVLVSVSAPRALSYKFAVIVRYNLNFAVKTTFLTVIALSVKLSVHNIIVNEFYNA